MSQTVNSMPYSRDAEMALLGCFLMDNDIVVELLEKLTEDDFVALNHDKPVEWTKQNFFRCIREGGLPSSDAFSHTYSMNSCHGAGGSFDFLREISRFSLRMLKFYSLIVSCSTPTHLVFDICFHH